MYLMIQRILADLSYIKCINNFSRFSWNHRKIFHKCKQTFLYSEEPEIFTHITIDEWNIKCIQRILLIICHRILQTSCSRQSKSGRIPKKSFVKDRLLIHCSIIPIVQNFCTCLKHRSYTVVL